MNNLTSHVEELTKIVVDIALAKHQNDIAIIAMYGSRAMGDYIDSSDLEFFAITDQDLDFGIEFLFQKIPIDLWSHSWEDTRRIANRESYWILPAGSIATCVIVYSRSQQDLDRFNTLRNQILNLQTSGEVFFEGIHPALNRMTRHLGSLSIANINDDFHQAYGIVWGLIINYINIICFLNGKYLLHNWGKNLTVLAEFEHQPKEAQGLIDDLIEESNIATILKKSTSLVDVTRKFIIKFLADVETEDRLDILNSVGSIEYLGKMNKAIETNHMPSLGYAIHNSQLLFAKDLVKIAGQWSKSHIFKLYSGYSDIYDKRYPDFLQLFIENKIGELDSAIENTTPEFLKIIQSQSDVLSFETLDEIKS